ncbi:uncharacterized protein LOC120195991 [Hibiscus syriacus]|uniref:uncharacterized protein LOC120195991 n=1 Tax=Hibiscus syriacus TaxID=106335 RepID=UPI001924AA45|nr:uncharacterized protein LOC120195991 [Hibiscus syriacus]
MPHSSTSRVKQKPTLLANPHNHSPVWFLAMPPQAVSPVVAIFVPSILILHQWVRVVADFDCILKGLCFLFLILLSQSGDLVKDLKSSPWSTQLFDALYSPNSTLLSSSSSLSFIFASFSEKMLNLTENPKLDSSSSNEISIQNISVSDHNNGFQYTTDNKTDSFVLDLEGFSHGGSNKEITQNSRFTKSLSRKGSQRGGDKKIISFNCTNSNCKSSLNDKDAFVATSPRGSSTAEKPVTAAVGSTDMANNPQARHQITITTGNHRSNREQI